MIENAFVNLYWNASEDTNGDEVSHNVVVNGNVVASRTKENSLDIDVESHLFGVKIIVLELLSIILLLILRSQLSRDTFL